MTKFKPKSTQIEEKKSNGDKTKKNKLWKDSTTQIVTKLKNSNCEKTKNSNCDITQKLKVWQKKIVTKQKISNCDMILMKLKSTNYDKTQKLKLWQLQKLKLWQNSKTQSVTQGWDNTA